MAMCFLTSMKHLNGEFNNSFKYKYFSFVKFTFVFLEVFQFLLTRLQALSVSLKEIFTYSANTFAK